MTDSRRARPRRGSVVLLLALLLAVNLPLVHSSWQRRQVERTGTDVVAEVTADAERGGRYLLSYRLPDGGPSGTAQVDEETHDAAVERGTVTVRVLPDDPAVHVVEGEVRGATIWVITLLADLLLVAAALLSWRYGGRRRPRLVLRATTDVAHSRPGAVLEPEPGGVHLVRGEVVEVAPGSLVLEVGDREVLVELDGHANPVGHQATAEVRGRLVG
ncbi:hypothetical protein [Nocardioides dongkuii]|uniref:hypothetical protein n=1 Tax=Nocardioides dongkuii TaxID=2760089 RepID=UPI001D0C365D|nr:hypothetical protein [Nocardioides dongkuii]